MIVTGRLLAALPATSSLTWVIVASKELAFHPLMTFVMFAILMALVTKRQE
jgi:hypothetical protein